MENTGNEMKGGRIEWPESPVFTEVGVTDARMMVAGQVYTTGKNVMYGVREGGGVEVLRHNMRADVVVPPLSEITDGWLEDMGKRLKAPAKAVFAGHGWCAPATTLMSVLGWVKEPPKGAVKKKDKELKAEDGGEVLSTPQPALVWKDANGREWLLWLVRSVNLSLMEKKEEAQGVYYLVEVDGWQMLMDRELAGGSVDAFVKWTQRHDHADHKQWVDLLEALTGFRLMKALRTSASPGYTTKDQLRGEMWVDLTAKHTGDGGDYKPVNLLRALMELLWRDPMEDERSRWFNGVPCDVHRDTWRKLRPAIKGLIQ